MTLSPPPAPQTHGPVRVWTLPTGPLQENAVLVAGPDSRGFLFDPGDEPERVLSLVRATGVQVEAILLTHAHFDHIGAVQPLREALGVPVYLHPDDEPMYAAGHLAAAQWGLPFNQPAPPDHPIAPGQRFEAGALTLTARPLPGHAPGHVIFVGEDFAVVGDTLFAGGVGRSDLPGGNHAQLMEGIQRELLTLAPETVLYPGHGPATTVGREAQTNPFL